MTQPVSFPSFVTKDYLINNFSRMLGERKESSGHRYTHFVPKQATSFVTNVPAHDKTTYPIYECNCRDTMGRMYRECAIENDLCDKVEQLFDKNKSLCLYSLGSGGCYEELATCVGLAKKGYGVKQIVLVDELYTNGLQNLSVVHFSAFFKILFPNAQIFAYANQSTYLDEIKNSSQTKPDIILCIDVEQSALSFRKNDYSKMLGSNNNQAIFVYHNPKDPFDALIGEDTYVDVISGNDVMQDKNN